MLVAFPPSPLHTSYLSRNLKDAVAAGLTSVPKKGRNTSSSSYRRTSPSASPTNNSRGRKGVRGDSDGSKTAPEFGWQTNKRLHGGESRLGYGHRNGGAESTSGVVGVDLGTDVGGERSELVGEYLEEEPHEFEGAWQRGFDEERGIGTVGDRGRLGNSDGMAEEEGDGGEGGEDDGDAESRWWYGVS